MMIMMIMIMMIHDDHDATTAAQICGVLLQHFLPRRGKSTTWHCVCCACPGLLGAYGSLSFEAPTAGADPWLQFAMGTEGSPVEMTSEMD